MLVGEPPFNGETAVSIAIKHIQDSIPNITTDKREEVPQALSNVVLRATEKINIIVIIPFKKCVMT